MKEIILKWGLASVIVMIAFWEYVPPEWNANLYAGGLIFALEPLFFDIIPLLLDIQRTKLRVQLLWLSFKGEKIRFSMAYQYVIKVDDYYLLVKNSNWNFYQHVGGKYKRNPSFGAVMTEFNGEEDQKLETKGKKRHDLAMHIPAKNALKFLQWFDKKKNREVGHWREFYEELIERDVLSSEEFATINYEFVKSVQTPLKKSPNLKCWEILQYDVLELIPTPTQEKILQKLRAKGDTDYVKWASYNLIQNDGHDPNTKKERYRIGEHTKWVVNLKWSDV